MLNEIITAKDRVRELLRKYPRCRDCDKELYLTYLYFHTDIRKLGEINYTAYMGRMVATDIPPPESISRARRLIQNNEGLYHGEKQRLRKEAANAVRVGIN